MALLASTLPVGTKYSTPQELLNLFAQNLSIPASDSSLFILSTTAPTDVSKVWIDTSGASPVLKIYLNGAWTSISVSSVFTNGLTVTGADVNLLGSSLYVSNSLQRVGIGTNTPAQKLDVAGTISCQNLQLTAGGTLAADIVTVGALISATGSTGSLVVTGAGSITTPTLTVGTTLSLPSNSVTTAMLNTASVTTAKLADDNVTSAKLAPLVRTDLSKAANVRPGATIPVTGKVKGVAIVNSGNGGYSSAPTVTIAPPSTPGGTTATAVATVAGGLVTKITVVEEGSGYTEINPTVTISGGGGANATAVAYACIQPLPVEYSGRFYTGGNTSAVITTHNTIKVAGTNSYGELGVGADTPQHDARDVFLWDIYYVNNNLPQPYPVQIYSSGYSNYVLASDGSLWSAGANGAGQLGRGWFGAQAANYSFARINFSGGGVVRKFAVNADMAYAGGTTCMALLETSTGKTLYGWGYNGYSQLGNGGTSDVNTPTPLTSIISGADNYDTISDIMVSGSYVYANCVVLFSSGKVRIAGYNGAAQLSNGGTATPPTAFAYVKVSAGTDLTGVVEIAGNTAYTCQNYFRTSAGRIYACGYNGHGQLGVGDTNDTTSYVRENSLGAIWPTGAGRFIYPSGAGNGTTITIGSVWAVAANGDLYRWGYNGNSQLADGSQNNRPSPVQLAGYNISNIRQIRFFVTTGSSGGIAILMNDNRLLVGGYNAANQLGLSSSTTQISSLSQVKFPQERIKDVCWLSKWGDSYSLAILATDGNLYTTGDNPAGRHFRGTVDYVVGIPTSARL